MLFIYLPFRYDAVTFDNNTNNRIESANKRIKMCLSARTHLIKALQQLLFIDRHIYVERMHRDMLDMRIRSNYCYSQEMNTFLNSITKEAAKVMEDYFDGRRDVKTSHKLISNTKCLCTFNTQMRLPCTEIMRQENISLESLLLSSRWRQFYTEGNVGNKENILPIEVPIAPTLSTRGYLQQRYHTAIAKLNHATAVGYDFIFISSITFLVPIIYSKRQLLMWRTF